MPTVLVRGFLVVTRLYASFSISSASLVRSSLTAFNASSSRVFNASCSHFAFPRIALWASLSSECNFLGILAADQLASLGILVVLGALIYVGMLYALVGYGLVSDAKKTFSSIFSR